MGRRPLSSYPADVAARMRAELAEQRRKAWAEGKYAKRQNAVLLPEVQARISDSVRALWAEGRYDDRVNGMSGRRGSEVPGWTWGKTRFKDVLAQHEPAECRFCGETENLNVHHVDENHDNYLLTNLLWACVACHAWRCHYRRSRMPVIELSRRIAFEYAHVLPWHPGKCARLHGHSGHLEVFVAGRLDPNGIVMDFKDLGDAVKLAVHGVLDHQFLNDYVANPTSENLLVWAWRALEDIGLKGMTRLTFSETDSSTCSLTAAALYDAFGWDQNANGLWRLVPKTGDDDDD